MLRSTNACAWKIRRSCRDHVESRFSRNRILWTKVKTQTRCRHDSPETYVSDQMGFNTNPRGKPTTENHQASLKHVLANRREMCMTNGDTTEI